MASNEPLPIGDTIGGENSNHLTEAVESVTSSASDNSSLNPRSAAYRAVHFAAPASEEAASEEEDTWWCEVETQNFTLDHVPNVTSVFTPSLEDIIDKPHCQEETNAVDNDVDFDRLHRLTDRIKSTMNEQRERHLSESSEKSLTDYSKQEVVQASLEPSQAETNAVDDDVDFNRLHRLTDRIKSTINQQRERHLSESSEKSLTDYSKYEIVQDPQASLETTKEQSLDEFKEELREKRMARQTAIQSFREEIANLRKQLEREREISKRLRNGEMVEPSVEEETENKSLPMSLEYHKNRILKEQTPEGACALLLRTASSSVDDEDALSRSRHANIELANAQLSLQMANSENISLRGELDVVQKHVGTLKEVVACCKQMLSVKEEQCNQLRTQLMQHENHQQHQQQQQQQQLQLQHLYTHPTDTNCCCSCHMPDHNSAL